MNVRVDTPLDQAGVVRYKLVSREPGAVHPEQDSSPLLSQGPVPTPPRAFGELVSRRHPLLVLLVLPFGVFLAAAPFLFPLEKSPLPEILQAYDALCRQENPQIQCVPRDHFLPRIERIDDQGNPSNAEYRLILAPRPDSTHRSGHPPLQWRARRQGSFWQLQDEPSLP